MSPTAFCPRYHHAVQIIGRRWTGAIVRALLVAGATRFSEITRAVPGLSDRLCSERLKELEAEGIVVREVIAETPVRVEYHLTAKGQALGEAVDALSRWAELWVCEAPEPRASASVSQVPATTPRTGDVVGSEPARDP